MAATVRIAAAQYPIEFLAGWDAFEEKLSLWVAAAVRGQAELLVFPEYGSMELASLFGPEVYSSLTGQLEALQTLHEAYVELYAALARQWKVHILAGSFPVLDSDGRYRNRAYLFGPEGLLGHQDKLIMTRFERELWGVDPGRSLHLFDTPLGRIGITICYDVEFPMTARRMVEAGAELILAPSCTDGLHGYHRVRTGCLARALENQCCVVQAPTVGTATWSEAVDVNVGAAAIYVPMDRGLPADGILAMGEIDRPQWVHATVDLQMLQQVRADGQVLVHRDWPRQHDVLGLPLLRS